MRVVDASGGALIAEVILGQAGSGGPHSPRTCLKKLIRN